MAAVQSTTSPSDIFAALNAKASSATDSTTSSADVENRFLKLLVTQLKNQDPLNPLDNAAVTTQISQINTVTGIEKLNTTLAGLVSTFNSSQAIQAAGLIGKSVLVAGGKLSLADGQAGGGVNLAGPADNVTLSILDASGKVVQSQSLGAQDAGSFSFVWDGKTDAGTVAPPGPYSFTVNAVLAGAKVTADPLQLGTVSALVRGTSGFQLELGALGTVAFDKVQQIL